MVEIIALIVAFFCLIGESTGGAILFLLVAAGGSAWRAYKNREETRQAQRELEAMRSELQRLTSLSERAVRIAAESANDVALLRRSAMAAQSAPSSAHEPEPAVVATVAAGEASEPKLDLITPLQVSEEVTKFKAPVVAQVRAPEPIVPGIAPVEKQQPSPEPAAPPRVTAPPPPPPARNVPVAPAAPTFAATSKAPPKPAGERLRSALAIEEILGTNWLNKLGVIILVLGIALFGIYELGQLGPFGKVGLSLAVSLGLLGGGIYLERKERYRILGRAGIGGGWALLFFTTYALDHVAAMRVMQSDALDSVLMLLVAGAMVAHTLRYRSQLVTGLAFLLAYSTVALSHDTVYSLAAGAILAAAVVAIVLKMEWYELEVFAILSSYGNHFYWLYRLLGEQGAQGRVFPEFMASSSLLVFYWAAFRMSYVVRKVRSNAQENLSTVAALLNTVLLLAVMKFQSAHPQLAFYALLILGAMEFALGQLTVTKRRRLAFVVLTMLGTALMVAAVPFRYSGQNVSILWLAGAEVLLFAGVFAAEKVFRRLGMGIGILVLGQVLIVELPRMLQMRAQSAAALTAQAVMLAVGAVVFYGNNTVLRLRWPKFFEEQFDDVLLTATSYPGAVMLGLACWAAFAKDGMAVAFAGAMFCVAVLGYWLKSVHMQFQFGALAIATVVRCAMWNAQWDAHGHLPERIWTLAVVAALFYATAKFAQHTDVADQRALRGIVAALGTAALSLLIFLEVPAAWQALVFVVFALALTESARATDYLPLRWHSHAVAAASVVLAATTDVASTPMWHMVRSGVGKLLPVVAVLYVIAKRGYEIRGQRVSWIASGYSWAASALATWLLYQGLEARYVAPAWVVYAALLMLVSRWKGWVPPAWQAFAIGAIASVQCGVINLLESAPGSHNSERLGTGLIVIAGLYVISEGLRLPDKWHEQEFEQLHSWLASALTGMLLWYELAPVGVAVAWAVFGLLLYEYASARKRVQVRWQGLLAIASAFVRIFFANLAVDGGGGWLSTRMITVLPVAAVCYYVYAREREIQVARQKFDVTMLLAYCGTAAVMALLYIQVSVEWVVTAWAALVMALLALALLVKQAVFVQQAVLASLAVLGRGMFHNLFGGSYFSGSDWRGRFGVLSSAVLLLLAALPLAFEHRRRSAVDPGKRGLSRIIAVLEHRAEQPLFFVAVALLTTMLTLKMSHGMVTLAWGVEAVLIFISALAVKERSFRLTGVLLLLACVVKIIVVDAWQLAPRDRYLTFIVLGASLLLVSFLYSKYSQTIRQYL